MKRYALAVACTAMLLGGLQAQISGSINRNAAKVTTTIAMGNNELMLNYTAIRFGQGEWQKIKDNTDRHDGFNKAAADRPLGRVKTSCEVQVAGKTVPAGEYAMYFTVNAQAGWILNLKPATGDVIRWRLHLSETDDRHECLKISLAPSAKDDVCSLSIAFGDMQVTVPVTVAAKKA